MEPNVYAAPKSEPLSSQEYRAILQATGRSVTSGIMLATILASVGSAAFTTWCATAVVVAMETAAQNSVAKAGPTLTLTGHIVFLTFGGIIGLLIGIIAVGIGMDTPIRNTPRSLPILAATAASILSFTCLFLVAGVFFAPPRDLMDLLFR